MNNLPIEEMLKWQYVVTYCRTLDMIEFTSNIVSNSSDNNWLPCLKTSANQAKHKPLSIYMWE